jgi:hypothetical protein
MKQFVRQLGQIHKTMPVNMKITKNEKEKERKKSADESDRYGVEKIQDESAWRNLNRVFKTLS